MIRPVACLMLVLLLAGCSGTLEAHRARNFIPGHNEPDVIACLGVPDQKTPTGTPGESVLQWDYSQTGTDLDLEFGVYSLKAGRPGICHTAVRFKDGIALGLAYPDSKFTATDLDNVCGRQVRECLHHIDHTALPPNYNGDAVLTGAPIIVRAGATKP